MRLHSPSFSRLDTFAMCPLRYAWDEICGSYPSTPAQLQGTQVHEFLQDAANGVIRGNAWSEGAFAYPCGPLSLDMLEDYYARALPFLECFIPKDTEVWFSEAAGLPIRGKIDLLSDTTPLTSEMGTLVPGLIKEPCVVDYKTIGNPNRTKTSAEVRRSLQLRIYCLATGIRRAGFVYLPPKTDVTGVFLCFSKEELEVTRRWLERTFEVIKAKWQRFFRLSSPVEFGDEFPDESVIGADWSVWNLAHPDNFLCQEKYCVHWSKCLGKEV